MRVAADARLVHAMLEDARLPVPESEVAASAEHAVAFARGVRAPVIVSTTSRSHPIPTQGPLHTADEIRAAYERASAHRGSVVVQRHVDGFEHRVLVVDGEVLSAARRSPPRVEGDGSHNVRQLVAASEDLAGVVFDAPRHALLARQGLCLDAIPPAGMDVVLGATDPANGGLVEDVTGRVHPEVAEACIRAARAIGLDVCAVDVACADIGESLLSQGGAILAVSAAPALTPREMRAAADRMVHALFPAVA
jgi:cyanophycin synthetase